MLAIDLPHLPIYHYVGVTGVKASIQAFQPNPNMVDPSWNSNEWWLKR